MPKPLRYVNAVAQALNDAMAADPAVMLMGEDVAAAGGPFKATRGLLDAHGPERVRDTPISEASLVGAAVGAALTGMKPVVEIMFMDFVTLAMDAVVNQAAKARFMFGGQCSVPMVLRTPHGGGLNAGPQHSQCLEAWFAHIPGLRVVCPATVADAYSLLRAAIEAPDPVVVVENKALYALQGDIDVNAPREVGKARIDRAGRDATIVTYGATLYAARAAADRLAAEGIEAEIVDLRWIQPWDEEAVFASVAKTHRVVIAHEAVQAFGVGAEIAARIASDAFDDLDAPVLRVGAPFMPIAFAKTLEAAYLPDADRIVAAVKSTLA
ncbi:alpha-ketoacid dehydrogenase subunit beta (plasmid) [Azospirillum brasilense]|uniref:Alpha-ketoacid dehydrogenase subunit beta n=2 Tax=Azospirillum TaxID=191 RepID=A0A4D8QQ92_AZOBR|nr:MULTISPECIES: alpha-ketoacid dehydrogenase subunit beta [Azospirillum]AWJ82219.1 alpha-ketoacid dehydrogenase subunit beta [Azospirillum sp. TSH58]MDW7554465.1 alpha-ketoacid dehydrogenase subunit beta [Azospirillum brasilense]MDW7556338.1 alpha-ketoacid dehydrogenase subunit beta [Azospirillum brasilense]MDW7594016.1 alpha-ketoacid dehydrogenase subunit beta [Azospirillum brasilense]MDW7632118.1 alpha-ketoacid dehydrogenase subunit beta [Azospirillum brasilense]